MAKRPYRIIEWYARGGMGGSAQEVNVGSFGSYETAEARIAQIRRVAPERAAMLGIVDRRPSMPDGNDAQGWDRLRLSAGVAGY